MALTIGNIEIKMNGFRDKYVLKIIEEGKNIDAIIFDDLMSSSIKQRDPSFIASYDLYITYVSSNQQGTTS
jgi:hypothetical protein